MKPNTKEALEQTLLAALQEGEAVEATPEWWQALRDEITKRSQPKKATRES